MNTCKLEFAVQMTCNSCVETVEKKLKQVKEINSFNIDLQNNTVVVNTSLPTEVVQKLLESTGKKVALRGLGDSLAGVVILEAGNSNVKGVIRLIQQNSNSCIVDGTIDGLSIGEQHKLSVHECGDLSQGCENVGNFFKAQGNTSYGRLGAVTPDPNGRAVFRFNSNMKLSEIIGRSMVVSKDLGDQRLACGIVARSAGLFQNPKTICACDGLTIWNEEVIPNTKL